MKSSSPMQTPLHRVRGLGAAKSGTHHFWLQRVTAVANVPLIIAMVVIMVVLVGADYAKARIVLGHPIVAVILLLGIGSVVAHMRLGMQVVIEDYIHGEGCKVLLLLMNNFFCIAVGLASMFALLKLSF